MKNPFPFCFYREIAQGKDQQVVEAVRASAIPRCCPGEICQSSPPCALMLKMPAWPEPSHLPGLRITGSYTATDPCARPAVKAFQFLIATWLVRFNMNHMVTIKTSLIMRMPEKGGGVKHVSCHCLQSETKLRKVLQLKFMFALWETKLLRP